MNRSIIRFFALAVGFGVVGPVAAHHPPLMERCTAFTFMGHIERIEWANPHVRLVVKADDGMSYEMTWLNIYQLGWAGIDRDTLHVGDEVTVTAGTRDDVVEKPMLLSAITRTRDGWEWSQTPQGC